MSGSHLPRSTSSARNVPNVDVGVGVAGGAGSVAENVCLFVHFPAVESAKEEEEKKPRLDRRERLYRDPLMREIASVTALYSCTTRTLLSKEKEKRKKKLSQSVHHNSDRVL